MFDMLTLEDLYKLHHQLGASGHKIHCTMMDGLTPLIPTLSDDWNVRAAAISELSETMYAVSAVIDVREAELVASRG
jgi:hypothetical protein